MARDAAVIDGVQCVVETGYGHVTKVEHTEGKRNARVVIDAEHLAKPVAGWADSHDTTLMDAISAARADGARVSYRIVVRRKPSIDPALPFESVTAFDRIRDLVGLRPAIGSDQAQAPPTPTAPVSGDRAPAAAPDEDPFPPAPAPAQSGSGPRVAEGKPWEPLNTDGSMNLGSYGYLAALSMVELAHEIVLPQLADQNYGEVESDAADVLARTTGLAKALLSAADAVQRAVRSDGHVDRMDGSHTRARGAIRTALTVYPPPLGAPVDERKAWWEALVGHASALLGMALDLAE
ncbi:MAG: hypothetical protein LC792_15055 [Actinobacteria bacterium]|nr:hypothetical protein [Actinomycetota bacterium]